MTDPQTPKPKLNQKPSSPSEPPKIPPSGEGFSAGPSHRNPPETVNPDAAALREQWRYAVRQYSKWYSHAWGTAILAGVSFFALGWVIKGSNPIHSFKSDNTDGDGDKPAGDVDQPR